MRQVDYLLYTPFYWIDRYRFVKKYYFPTVWESRVGNEMCSHAPISVLPFWSQQIIAQTEARAEMQACQRLNQRLSHPCAHPFEEGSLWWLFKQLLGYLFPNNVSLSGLSLSLWRHKHYLGRFYLCNSLLSSNFCQLFLENKFLGCLPYITFIWITHYTLYTHHRTGLSFSLLLS